MSQVSQVFGVIGIIGVLWLLFKAYTISLKKQIAMELDVKTEQEIRKIKDRVESNKKEANLDDTYL